MGNLATIDHFILVRCFWYGQLFENFLDISRTHGKTKSLDVVLVGFLIICFSLFIQNSSVCWQVFLNLRITRIKQIQIYIFTSDLHKLLPGNRRYFKHTKRVQKTSRTFYLCSIYVLRAGGWGYPFKRPIKATAEIY